MSDKDTIRIRVGMSVNYIAASTREDVEEIDRAEWDAMTPEQRDNFLNEMARDFAANHLDFWAFPDED